VATPSQPPKRSTGQSASIANKKVAKAARAGGGPSKKSRYRSDSFNLTVIGVCIAGVALVVGSIYGKRILESAPFIGNRTQAGNYESKKLDSARKAVEKLQKAKKPDAKKIAAAQKNFESVLADTHWHSAYGIYNCDHWEPAIDGTNFADAAGVHAHEDGLMHIHPFTTRAAGRKAKLGLWTDAVFLDVTKKSLKWPVGTTGVVTPTAKMYTTLKVSDGCKDKAGKKVAARVAVYKWDSAKDTTVEVYTEDFRTIPLVKSGAYAFVFAPTNAKVAIPASISAVETPADLAVTTTTIAPTGSTIVVGATTTKPGSDAATTTKAVAATTTVASPTTSTKA
jgi:hypothetical protein